MDIFGGSAICTGPNNLFTPFYNSSPVGITVEGSNTLTRSLIIFGQGLNKSHPYIYNIFKSTQTNNLDDFKNNFNAMVKDVVKNYGYSLFNNQTDSIKRLEMLTYKFSTVTNFVALLGGKIKGNQMISGNTADILSNIYLGYSLVWTHNNHTSKDLDKVRDYCIHELCQEAERKLNLVIYNYPNSMIRFLLTFIKVSEDYSKFKDVNDIYKFISENKEVVDILKDGIYYEGTVVEKLEKLNEMEPTSKEYKDLYQDIISVGEYRS
jgi:acyl-CoA dehydrogenase